MGRRKRKEEKGRGKVSRRKRKKKVVGKWVGGKEGEGSGESG